MIHNCPLNPEYSVRANQIYGTSIPLPQGDIKPRINSANRVTRVPLPTDILLHHKNI